MRKTINNQAFRSDWLICFLIPLIWTCYHSCNKYLDAKPDQTIATPSTIEDLEGILNNYNFINARYPSASEVSADNFYLTTEDWNTLIDPQRNFYTWQKYDNIGGDYTAPYSAIEYANIILNALPKIQVSDATRKNAVQGNALFIRASYHYALSQLFAKAYDESTADHDLGIALRLTSDIAIKPVRSTGAETYSAILKDLKGSIPLLPASSILKYRASKPAAYGMLARVYLSMSDYKNAGLYADSALTLYNKLIDYNTISSATRIPFPQFNDEVIYDARTSPPQALSASKARIDTILYDSYASNDLRKTILFKLNADGSYAFKGNYTGQNNASLFTGIATDELYLIKAEAAIRNGNVEVALQSINTLLSTRWSTGTYAPYTVTDPAQLLTYILQERRKELLFRTLRWTDLRRLNKESGRAVVLTRNVNDSLLRLEPQSLRYVFEIDQNAVHYSGLIQNP
jgi:hypothetical protein